MDAMIDSSSTTSFIPVGTRVSFAKTIGESDIYLFSGITGDFSPNHVNAEYMRTTPYGTIIAHGALVVGLMSTCSTRALDHALTSRTAVSYGYDRIRFVKPVRVGDTITVTYEIESENTEEAKTVAAITATNQHDEVVAVATHILKFL
jgi:3-hydroxybutyryl-CoA dehydratase